MKKLAALGLSALLACSSVTALADTADAKIFINNEALVSENAPVFENDRILVPMRAIFEALSVSIGWDGETNTISAQDGNHFLLLQIDNPILFSGEVQIPLDVAPRLFGESTYVPLRAVSEALDCTVDWDPDTRTVQITR